MRNELFLRITCIVVVVASLGVWLGLFWRVGINQRTHYDKREGFFAAVAIRLLMYGAVLASLTYGFYPPSMQWSAVGLLMWSRWTGVPLAALAIGMMAWVLQTLGQNYSMTLTIKEDHALVTSGPYRWVRHPMYLALLAMMLSFFLITANWFVGLIGLGGTVLLLVLRLGSEEAMMLEHFGDDYRAYMRRTGRCLPRWRINDGSEVA